MTTLSPMTPAEFEEWREASLPVYARDKALSGEWSEAEAPARARAELDALLPHGLGTPGHHLWAIRDAAQAESVGALWVGVQTSGARRVAYVFDLLVKPAHRRQGHARRAFLALERELAVLELDGISLHVFGHNAAARALYESLGYAATNLMMFKPLR
jgi:ribosomal protein S18 acetylase RimI-like enzyme